MAEQNQIFTGPETEEAFLADRQRFFSGFTTFTMVMTIAIALLLIVMAITLV